MAVYLFAHVSNAHMLVMQACERACIYVYLSVHVIVHTYSCRTRVYTDLATCGIIENK
jgi:S-adenosylmethionine/arginine decarboxylase-like enzyme